MNSQLRYQELIREFNAGRLIAHAQEIAGLSDFGDLSFTQSLEQLIGCVARDVDFHAQGISNFKQEIVRCLVNRLRMQYDLEQHPEIFQENVSDPIIITGLGRSGTTKLQKILSAPDDVQKTFFWRLWNPSRVPGADPNKPDPRIAAAFESFLMAGGPAFDAAHHVEQQEADEDWTMYMMTFADWMWFNFFPTPSYVDWVMQRSSLDAYRYMQTVMKYLQWQDGGRQGRPWVMKGIGYMANLDSLLDCYPDATLIHSHREPQQTIPSFAKTMAALWPIQSTQLDPRFIGKEVMRIWRIVIERYLEARDRLKLDGRIVDVQYEQVRNDPVLIARKVYESRQSKLSAVAEQKMAAWHNSNEQGRFGKHEYSLAEFGLTSAKIDEAFSDYIKRFIKR